MGLFMTDAHGNYLALSVDGKTYYLNHSCVSSFSEYLSSKGKRGRVGGGGGGAQNVCYALVFLHVAAQHLNLKRYNWLMSFVVIQNTLHTHTHTHTHTHIGSWYLVESQREHLWKLER